MDSERENAPEPADDPDDARVGDDAPWWHRESEEASSHSEGSTSALLGVALEEVMKLADGVHRWGSQAGVGQTLLGAAEDLARAWRAGEPTDNRYCRVCPFCRTLGAIDSTNPDLARHLLDMMAVLSELIQTAGQSVVAEADGAPADGERADGERAHGDEH